MRTILTIGVFAMIALALPGAWAEQKFVLTSVTVDLPFGDRMFPDGRGSNVATSN